MTFGTSSVSSPPLVSTEGNSLDANGQPPSSLGMGGDTGSLSSLGGGDPGIADLLWGLGTLCLQMFRELHQLVFYCPPEILPKKNPEVEAIEKFLETWDPQEVIFFPDVQPADVQAQLNMVSQEKLSILFEAFKTALSLGKEVNTIDELVIELPTDRVLKFTLPGDNRDLYRPYGRTTDHFKNDIQRLPEEIKTALKSYTEDASLEDYFSNHPTFLFSLLRKYLP